MTTEPTVSAVIPVFNGEEYLGEAIQSTLDQSHPPIECIVVDDGSSDSTPEVVRRFGAPVRYVRQDHLGVSTARNTGARVAQGVLVAFLDHDDVWLPAKLERQIEALQAAGRSAALCAMRVVDAAGRELAIKRLRSCDDLLEGMLMFDGTETVSCSSTGLVKRDGFLQCGGFDPALSTSADWDLLLRILLDGGIAYVDEPLVSYRVHGSNMSRNVSQMERDMRFAFRKAFSDPRLPSRLLGQRRHAYGRLYRMLAGSYRDSGQMPAAIRMLALAVSRDPAVAFEAVRNASSPLRRPGK